jgi:hypothetical protein
MPHAPKFASFVCSLEAAHRPVRGPLSGCAVGDDVFCRSAACRAQACGSPQTASAGFQKSASQRARLRKGKRASPIETD